MSYRNLIFPPCIFNKVPTSVRDEIIRASTPSWKHLLLRRLHLFKSRFVLLILRLAGKRKSFCRRKNSKSRSKSFAHKTQHFGHAIETEMECAESFAMVKMKEILRLGTKQSAFSPPQGLVPHPLLTLTPLIVAAALKGEREIMTFRLWGPGVISGEPWLQDPFVH